MWTGSAWSDQVNTSTSNSLIATKDTKIPEVATTTLLATNGEHYVVVNPAGNTVLRDSVTLKYANDYLHKTLTVRGQLFYADGTAVTVGGGAVTSTGSITPTSATQTFGNVLTYTFDASALGGKSVVSYVEVYDGSEKLCEHKDRLDESQTVQLLNSELAMYKTGAILSGATYHNTGVTFEYLDDQRIPGASYQVTAAHDIYGADGKLQYAGGSVVANVTTGDDGSCTLYDLPLGTYTVTETDSPMNFYNDGQKKDVTLSYENRSGMVVTGSATIQNARHTITVQVAKTESVAARAVPGAQYGLYAAEDITTRDGRTVVPKDALVAAGITDDGGSLTFDVDLPAGFSWYARELWTPIGFKLSTMTYTETFSDRGRKAATFTDTLRASDDEQPGTVEIQKLDTSGRPLAGVTYLLEYAASETGPWNPVFANDGSTADGYVAGGCDSAGLSNGRLTTGADGWARFTGLKADGRTHYKLTEVGTVGGMMLLEDDIYVGTLPRVYDDAFDIAVYDVNGDGLFSDADVQYLGWYLVGASDIGALTPGSGDVNGDGSVTSYDMSLMIRNLNQYLSGGTNPYDYGFNRNYTVTYEITDTAQVRLPMTGSSGFDPSPFIAAGVLFAFGAAALTAALRRRKRSS